MRSCWLIATLTAPLLSLGMPPAAGRWSPPAPPYDPATEPRLAPLRLDGIFDPLPAPVSQPQLRPRIEIIRCRVTAYTPYDPEDQKHGWTGVTSTGLDCSEVPHGVAADPRALPYGTLVRIPGYTPSSRVSADAWWPVDDTGGRMRGSWRQGVVHIDVRFIHMKHARRWGTRWVDVEVIRP